MIVGRDWGLVLLIAILTAWGGFVLGVNVGKEQWREPCLAIIEKTLRDIAPANRPAATKKEEGDE